MYFRLITILPLVIILSFVSCSKDIETDEMEEEVEMDTGMENCTGFQCDQSNQSFENEECKPVFFGSFQLSSFTDSILVDFNLEVNDTIKFQNGTDELIFEVSDNFENDSTLSSHNTFNKCQFNNDKDIYYCLSSQQKWIFFNPINSDIYFNMRIATIPDIREKELGRVGDNLRVFRRIGAQMARELDIIIDNRTLSYENTNNYEFYDSLELGQTKYFNVYSYNIENFTTQLYKYYIDQSNGLIAFIDDEDKLWIRNE